VRIRRLRAGELLALLGAVLVIVSLFEPWYEGAGGTLDAWATFSFAVASLMAAAAAALALVLATLTERTTAHPVALGVWCVVLGMVALPAAVVRLLHLPDHAMSVCAGAWLAFAGSLAILVGAWQALRDERQSVYEPATPPPRPPPDV
jgi:hypothetical protein